MGGVQRGEHIAQPVDEHAAIDGFVARAGGGQEDQAGDAGGQDGDAVGPRDVAAQPGDAVRVVSGRLAPQGMDFHALDPQPPRGAQAQVAAADEQRALGHAHMPL